MLYRFREAQAAELGLGTRSDRRPRMASTCKSMRECERWRGEILREISRKVSKIQDSGLTDYEVRDLNDEINKLLREKRHWENQIIALGGANYRRNVAMLDDDGKEVPGTKGYKYFGGERTPRCERALPKQEEGTRRGEHRPDLLQEVHKPRARLLWRPGRQDGKLLEYERAAEQEEWEDAHRHIRTALGSTLSITDQSPAQPNGTPPPHAADTKRKAQTSMQTCRWRTGTATQRLQNDNILRTGTYGNGATAATPDATALQYARTTAAYIPFLSADDLVPPKMPTQQEMEKFLLDLRKKALVEEYFGEQQS
ncbi:Isy1-like splicing factor [Irpex lacteus]|nr:Isy1-like splicing factor [Irpex lacteus]